MKNTFAAIALACGLSLAATWSSTQDKRPVYVPSDAATHNGKYYKFFKAKYSWREAEKKCEEMKGVLVSIKNKETHQFLLALSKGKCFWAGASDARTEGVWLWRDGSKITYSDWAKDEPDDWKGKEDCLVIGWPGKRYENGKWADTNYKYRKQIDGYICEWK